MHATWFAALLTAPLVFLACDKPESTSAGTSGGKSVSSATSSGPKVTAFGSVTDGAAVEGVAEVVADMRADFQRCYQSALEKDPTSTGSVRVTVDVGATGAIGSASSAASKGIGKDLANCIATRVRKAKFKAPNGGRATVMITIDLSN
jgi:hypothetical protein